MLSPVLEHEEEDLFEEIEELDLFDVEQDQIIHEMTDWVQYELDN
jgi:hypothetical protein